MLNHIEQHRKQLSDNIQSSYFGERVSQEELEKISNALS